LHQFEANIRRLADGRWEVIAVVSKPDFVYNTHKYFMVFSPDGRGLVNNKILAFFPLIFLISATLPMSMAKAGDAETPATETICDGWGFTGQVRGLTKQGEKTCT
jgi:hypothetical protein